MEKFKRLYQKSLMQWITISFALTFFVELLSKRSFIKTFLFICNNPLVFLLNVSIVMVPIGLSYLFKHRLFVLGITSFIIMLIGVVNFVLLSNRVTPFVPADLLLLKDAFRIVDGYLSVFQIILIIVGLVCIIAGLILIYLKVPTIQHRTSLYKKVSAWVALIFVVLVYNQVARITGLIPKIFTNIAQAYQDYGVVVCFSYGIFDTGISKPSKYNDHVINTIMEEVEAELETDEIATEENLENQQESAIKENAQKGKNDAGESSLESIHQDSPNIIFVQLESFYDLTEMNNLTCSEDPIPYFHQLMEEYTSGYLTVPVIGAGTANTEFEVITGMNLDFFGPGEYPYKTVLKTTTCESMAYDMKAMGYATHAIHNNTAVFYSRNTVFPQLGFDTFLASEYMENISRNEIGWVKDEVLIPQIVKTLRSTDSSDLIYTISVQGHGAYPIDQVLTDTKITVSGIENPELLNQFTYYANQIHEMDLFVKKLIENLESMNEECIVVFYGDHLPTLGIEESMTGGKSLFETPLLIWDNIGLSREEVNLEAYQLSAYVFNRLGFHEGVLTKLHQAYFPSLIEENGKDIFDTTVAGVPEIDSIKEEYIERLEILEYDILYGKMDVYGGENPYETTDMKLWIDEVQMTNASYFDGAIYVKGNHFTEASRVVVDEEILETEYVSDKLLVVRNFIPKEGQELYVIQYAENDKVVLSQTKHSYIRLRLSIYLEDELSVED